MKQIGKQMKQTFIFLICTLLTSALHAQVFKSDGEIYQLVVKNKAIQGGNTSFVEIKGFNEAGSCPKGGVYIKAVIPDEESGDRMYSLLLSAALSKTEVEIQVDTSHVNSEGYCYLRNVRYVFR